jgi:hypothetical protein
MTEADNNTPDHVKPSNDECAKFQAAMPDRIGAGEDLTHDPHLVSCERCSALLSELEYIAEMARLLAAEESDPSDAVWNKIVSAMKQEQS